MRLFPLIFLLFPVWKNSEATIGCLKEGTRNRLVKIGQYFGGTLVD
jgi:hypothetical protein